MKLVADYNNLVIVGLWNRHIFYPEWVGQYLLPETELTAEYPLNIAGSFRVSSINTNICAGNATFCSIKQIQF